MMKPKARTENIVVQDVGTELLIYDLKINKAFCLNETAALVWEFCDGRQTVSEITAQIEKRLGSNVNEEMILLALRQLADNRLMLDLKGSAPELKGVRRREALLKIAQASIIAIPLVTSVVAPSAAFAASPVISLCVVNNCVDGTVGNGPGCNPPAGCPSIGLGFVCCASSDGSCVCSMNCVSSQVLQREVCA